MNNSLERLIDGMAATLRTDVIPHIEGEYARGQAFGVIYMLNSLKLRASWSNAFLSGHLEALADVARALEPLAAELPGAPLPGAPSVGRLPEAGALEALRDEGEAQISALIDWLAGHGGQAPQAVVRARALVDAYIDKQIKYELGASARPMFVEMSGGAEKG